jgi:CDP-paratose synthetase
MNILLTGITGYLGSYLAKMLIREGHNVIALKREKSSLQRLKGLEDEIVFYNMENLDIRLPFTQHGQVEVVIHTSTCYGRLGETFSEIFEINTAFPLKLFETAISFNVLRFFNTDTILHPDINTYSLTKRYFSDWGKRMDTIKSIQFINIRLDHFYGPGDNLSKFTTWVVESCIKNVPEIKLTWGEQKRDFIFIEDLVSAYKLILDQNMESDNSYQNIDFGSGKSITVRDFVETVHRLSDSSTKLFFGALSYRTNEPMNNQMDIGLMNAIGWSPCYSLEKGLEKTLSYSKPFL